MSTKICKMCMRMLPIDNFERYAYRGKLNDDGAPKYDNRSHHTTCKQCETLERYAKDIVLQGTTGPDVDKLTDYLKKLGPGIPLKYCRRLAGLPDKDVVRSKSNMGSLIDEMAAEFVDPRIAECRLHIQRLKDKSYPSLQLARTKQIALEGALRDLEMYEEASDAYDEFSDAM